MKSSLLQWHIRKRLFAILALCAGLCAAPAVGQAPPDVITNMVVTNYRATARFTDVYWDGDSWQPIMVVDPSLEHLLPTVTTAAMHVADMEVELPEHGEDSALYVTDYEITKAKRIYLSANPRCAVCDAKANITNGHKNNVHHLIPVHVDRSLAASQSNFVTLCRNGHFWVGHCGNWKSWNTNITATIMAIRKAYRENAVKAIIRSDGTTNVIAIKDME